ncbi:FAD-dependent monooxygenase [Isoptericola sp. NEAU-Y5]|uniref:FAD-dependent monooxygenase n=1 Tax=Isoptericola luteus TaxID=2879484 RepID=A0ABS7ZIW8_9MICO|nr:NAD(P)/FAD-dependent oxidoreductase [Isoptericola sp. NEAU-Y5]MCA5894976.1 FAD-dependent monooxygenase [Isoptericola sp. NEAU-Y5]
MRALVIGGGIGGPVTAMALQKAGVEATVHEAYARTADDKGAFLTLAPNGLHALGVLGIDHRDLGGFDTPMMEMRGASGRFLTRMPTGGAAGAIPSQTVRRADLSAALRDEAERRGIAVEHGKRLTDAVEQPDGTVVAAFADGTTATGDLLVGADGIGSRTRRLLDPAGPAPRYTGLLNTGGYARGVDVDATPGHLVMVFGRRAFFAYLRRAPGDVWWFANVPQAAEPTPAQLAARTPTWRAELERLFADDDSPALDLLAATPEILGPWTTTDLPHVPVWHRGRIGLVGDAAHAISPTSGQGASLAIEDGVLLARCVRDLGDPAAAFAALSATRRRRVERLITQAKRTSNLKIPNPVSRVLRDRVILPLVGRVAARATHDWVTDFRVDWDEPVTATTRP